MGLQRRLTMATLTKKDLLEAIEDMPEKEIQAITEIITANLDGIYRDVERMTSGNFMHNKYSIRVHAGLIKGELKRIGLC